MILADCSWVIGISIIFIVLTFSLVAVAMFEAGKRNAQRASKKSQGEKKLSQKNARNGQKGGT